MSAQFGKVDEEQLAGTLERLAREVRAGASMAQQSRELRAMVPNDLVRAAHDAALRDASTLEVTALVLREVVRVLRGVVTIGPGDPGYDDVWDRAERLVGSDA